jgi:mevalonate kinase
MVRQRREAAPTATTAILERLGALSERAIQVLAGTPTGTTSSDRELGVLAQEAHTYLDELGVATPELNTIIAHGTQAGARGGKLSGAGGGGAFYLVCSTEDEAAAVARAIRPVCPPGSTVFIAEPGATG